MQPSRSLQTVREIVVSHRRPKRWRIPLCKHARVRASWHGYVVTMCTTSAQDPRTKEERKKGAGHCRTSPQYIHSEQSGPDALFCVYSTTVMSVGTIAGMQGQRYMPLQTCRKEERTQGGHVYTVCCTLNAVPTSATSKELFPSPTTITFFPA